MMATSAEFIQLTGIGVGAIVALMTMMVGMFIWTTNYRDKSNYRQHQETRIRVDERYKETFDLVERRHRETLELVDCRYHQTLELVDRRYHQTLESMERLRQQTHESVDWLRQETYESVERLQQETAQMFERSGEQNDRRHQELLAAIRPLYHHVHSDDGQVIIPAEEVAPAPADN